MTAGVVRPIGVPAPVLTPKDIPSDHREDDDTIAAWISAAQSLVDGPRATLCAGHAFGVQTLEWNAERFETGDQVPFPPLLDILSVSALPEGRKLVRFKAGYDGKEIADGGTGPVPEAVKVAVKLLVKDLMMSAEIALSSVRSETVDGVGQTSYVDPERVSLATRRAATALLVGFRIYRP